jgi:ABC-type multidrug transport system ATPase subunit
VLTQTPEVLLLDEPTSGLDQDTTRQVEAVLRARADDGVALLFSTHDEALAERLGDRAIRVRDGKVTEAA